MIREVHVEVGGGPAHEGLCLQGGVAKGLVEERMNQAQGEADGEGCLTVLRLAFFIGYE